MREIKEINFVEGELKLPGDKSISHRAVIFSSLADGESEIENLSNGEDVKSTMSCFQKLGCRIQHEGDKVKITGHGLEGLQAPAETLYAGNSGTTSRLISGILCMQKFYSKITGDASLSKRPMKRVIDPLKLMGADIRATENFTLPLEYYPSQSHKAIEYEMPVASAQVKSAILLAGLYLDEETTVIESVPSRNHTEVMLNLSVSVSEGKNYIKVSRKNYPKPAKYIVPSDISTAAFFIVLGLLAKNSELTIKNVSLNETRTGILSILKEMGGQIEIANAKTVAGEKMGDVIVKSSKLKNIEIKKEIIPNIIDEILILSVAGLFAEGDFTVRNAKELRAKESDRINSLCVNYKAAGVDVKEYDDGFTISGSVKTKSPVFESFDDHRVAMSFAILCCLLNGGGKINGFECVNISNPNFMEQLKQIIR